MSRVRAGIATLAAWTCGEAPAWSLGRYLLLALAFRVPAVLFAHGYEFVDQQFQYADPAWHLATGDAWYRSWEWLDGIRSWVYPGVLAQTFRLCEAIGLHEPLQQMTAIRALHALSTLLPAAAFWLLAVRWRPLPRPRPALLLFATAGVGAYCVQPSGPTVAASLAVAAVLLFGGPGRWPPFAAGLCLGFAFCARFQEALLGPVLFVAGFAARRPAASLWLVAGCLPGILTQGITDALTWGRFLHSPFAYVDANLLRGASSSWREQPWWFYAASALLPALLLAPPFLRSARRLYGPALRYAPWLAAAIAVHLLAHSLVPRKSVRFVWAALWLLSAFVAIGFGCGAARSASERWHRRLLVLLHAPLLLLFASWFHHAGPVLAARAIGQDRTFERELVVVDGYESSAGGWFWLRRPVVDVHLVARAALRDWLASAPARPRHLIVVRDPLSPDCAPPNGTLQSAGAFHGLLDLRARDRRYVYRWTPAGSDGGR